MAPRVEEKYIYYLNIVGIECESFIFPFLRCWQVYFIYIGPTQTVDCIYVWTHKISIKTHEWMILKWPYFKKWNGLGL